MKATFLVTLLLFVTSSLHAATVTRRVPILYSSSLNRALVVAIADSGNFWISECEVNPNDAMTLAENISNPKNACRRLRESEFPLADVSIAKAVESFSESFYKEGMLARMNRGSFAPTFLLFAVLNGGMSLFFYRTFPGNPTYKMPAVMGSLFGFFGLTSLIYDYFQAAPNPPQAVEAVISQLSTPQESPKIIRALSEEVYKVYRESLAKAIDTVGTDYTKIPKAR